MPCEKRRGASTIICKRPLNFEIFFAHRNKIKKTARRHHAPCRHSEPHAPCRRTEQDEHPGRAARPRRRRFRRRRRRPDDGARRDSCAVGQPHQPTRSRAAVHAAGPHQRLHASLRQGARRSALPAASGLPARANANANASANGGPALEGWPVASARRRTRRRARARRATCAMTRPPPRSTRCAAAAARRGAAGTGNSPRDGRKATQRGVRAGGAPGATK